jgi:hypothetical protein
MRQTGPMSSPAAIAAFWGWFASIAAALARNLEDGDLLAELDARLRELGPLGWELGPGRKEPCSLVISPAGDRAMLELTRAIVAAAPALHGWELWPAKPPRPWDFQLEVDDLQGTSIAIDASTWRYAIRRSRGGSGRELVLEAPELGSWPADEQRAAAEIILDSLLGEERRLESVVAVRVTARLDEDAEARALPLAAIAIRPLA